MTRPLRAALAALLIGASTALSAAPLAGTGVPGATAARAGAGALPRGVEAVRSVEGIDEYRLANGLQVLLVADPSKPTTTVNLTIRVGSRHENYGETGMAHLLEHMMFKGTPRHPNVWAEFEKRGLAANGSTWYDRTNYTAKFSASEENLRWMLGWLADALVNSFIARRDLESEMTVVRNEMEAGENRPDQMLFQRVLSAMYDWHNYGKDTIGARSDVENVDIPRLRAFYREYYQPDNATLIVSGQFEAGKTLSVIGQTFSALRRPARKLPRLYTLDAAQDGERAVTLRRVGGTPAVFVGYHMPAGPDPDFAAAELLASILGEAPSGRLHKALTERGLAADTFGYTQALADPGFLILGAQLAPAQSADAARDALVRTVEGLRTEPVTEPELRRAKARWLKGWERGFANPEAIGFALSEYVAQGDWRLYFAERDRVRDIALADVQRVAAQWLVASNRTVGTYVPTEQPARAPAPRRVAAADSLRDFKPREAAARIVPFDASPANIDALTARGSVGPIRLALLPKPTRGGVVHAVLTLRFGDADSLAGRAEVASAVAALLDKGTASLGREAVQDRLDELRSVLRFGGGADRIAVIIESRREHIAQVIALAGELLREPAFPADAFDELKRQLQARIEEQRKEPEALAQLAVERHADRFPRGDVRHVRNFDEWAADVDALTLDAVRDFHRRFYGASDALFAAVGDFAPAAVEAALGSAFAGWSSPIRHARIALPRPEVEPMRTLIRTPDKQNATFVAQLALPISDRHADHPALLMADYLLGGGGNSRLWKRIREREGLSYDVRTGIRWRSLDENSTWEASAIFAPQNRAKVEAAFREELERALREGFVATELREGQRGLLSFRRLSRAQDARLAGAWVSNLELDRTFARAAEVDAAIGGLTLAEVNAALRKYIDPARIAIAYAGDFKE